MDLAVHAGRTKLEKTIEDVRPPVPEGFADRRRLDGIARDDAETEYTVSSVPPHRFKSSST